MKYNDKNKPLVCMMTQSTCYKGTRKFTPKGVLWHSTGANNPWLKRYVQPDDNAANKAELLKKLGTNAYKNDWNHIYHEAGLNFWIGKLADGTVAAVQTMPFDFRPWGCGAGNKGSCNNTHIQFEICEDGLNDKSYFDACYKEALEMTAYLCKMYNIDPMGTTVCDGVKVPTIIDHTGSCSYGLGSNHGDIQHWSRKYGITMDTVRKDVATLMGGSSSDGSSGGSGSGGGTTTLYRVRKSWADAKSQKDAFKVLDNAKKCADKNPGYSVFDGNGKAVYTSGSVAPVTPSTPSQFPYFVKIKITDLNYRKGPSTSYESYGFIKQGVYTIVDEKDGWGLLKAYADKRNGWVYLKYTERT
ncbi:hypothetical protein SAMN02910317_03245 [Ruminococcaceae bacterium FB2012]|nr:hypothetical protein SAMN02910317_03245 [Ruminococcaceae bacterium FB2012]